MGIIVLVLVISAKTSDNICEVFLFDIEPSLVVGLYRVWYKEEYIRIMRDSAVLISSERMTAVEERYLGPAVVRDCRINNVRAEFWIAKASKERYFIDIVARRLWHSRYTAGRLSHKEWNINECSDTNCTRTIQGSCMLPSST